MTDLHLTYLPDPLVRARLDEWDDAVRREGPLRETTWGFLAFWPAASSATTSASTGIEGNPLSPDQVEAVLANQSVDAEAMHIREVVNYNRAMAFAHRTARRADFVWSHGVIQEVNALVTDGLPGDNDGRYRSEDVHVGIFQPPGGLVVDRYMDALVDWLQRDRQTPLVRVALLHLNLVAIHPFEDGNGRTARVLAALELIRDGVSAPELVSIEPYLRRNRDEYLDTLRQVLGVSYRPEEHPVTAWLDYYTRISIDRLHLRDRLRDTVPNDIGQITLALAESNAPTDWTQVLFAAAVRPIRTRDVAEWMGRSAPAARALLGRMTRHGWLEPVGRTRSRRFVAGERLRSLPLRSPELAARLRAGEPSPGDDP